MTTAQRAVHVAVLALLVLLAAACGGGEKKETGAAATPQATTQAAAAGTPKPAWQVAWENTVEAAKKEKLVVVTHPGDDYAELIAAFKKAYPGIAVEHSGLRPSDFAPKLLTEQQNGVYNYDVWTTATSNMNNVVMPAGGFQELPPFLLLPEVTDVSQWRAGLMYTSEKGKFILLHDLNVANDIYVNRQMLPKSEFNSAQQLLDPKLKGKITMRAPSAEHSGSLTLTALMNAYGEDFVRRLLTDQQPTFIADAQQSTDALIRGRTAVLIGSAPEVIEQCWREGGCKQIEQLPEPRYALGRGVAVFKNAPHPNAAKVFVNWLLSREGQQKFVEIWAKYNHDGAHSMRADVEPIHKDSFPDYSNLKQYTLQGTDFGKPLMDKVIQMYKDVRK